MEKVSKIRKGGQKQPRPQGLCPGDEVETEEQHTPPHASTPAFPHRLSDPLNQATGGGEN